MKHVKRLVYIVSVALVLWVTLSYIDIFLHNVTTCVYSKFNFFTLVFGRFPA